MSRPDADDPRWAWKEYADELQAELERTRLQRDLATGITDEHLTTILELQAELTKLREELLEISVYDDGTSYTPSDMRNLAKAALKGDKLILKGKVFVDGDVLAAAYPNLSDTGGEEPIQ
jgi:hypothetical protein